MDQEVSYFYKDEVHHHTMRIFKGKGGRYDQTFEH